MLAFKVPTPGLYLYRLPLSTRLPRSSVYSWNAEVPQNWHGCQVLELGSGCGLVSSAPRQNEILSIHLAAAWFDFYF